MNASVTLRDGSGNVKNEVQVRIAGEADITGLVSRTCHEADATIIGMSTAADVDLAIAALEQVKRSLNDTAEHVPLTSDGKPQG